MLSRIEITTSGPPGNGRSRVLLDGHDITGSVTAHQVSAKVGHITEVYLTLYVTEASTHDLAMVYMDPGTAALLRRHGWTPPEGNELLLAWHECTPTPPAAGGTVNTTPATGDQADFDRCHPQPRPATAEQIRDALRGGPLVDGVRYPDLSMDEALRYLADRVQPADAIEICSARWPGTPESDTLPRPTCVGLKGHDGLHAAPYLGPNPLGHEYTWDPRVFDHDGNRVDGGEATR